MATNYPNYTSTGIWGTTTSATSGESGIWIDTGTGGQCVRVHNPYVRHPYCVECGTTIDNSANTSCVECGATTDNSTNTSIDKISKAITKKDLNMVKDEVRKYMKTQMLIDAKEIAGKLFKDIESLKEEKTQLKKEVTELKTYLEKAQEDIHAEVAGIEEMLERRANAIGKFKYLDFSNDE